MWSYGFYPIDSDPYALFGPGGEEYAHAHDIVPMESPKHRRNDVGEVNAAPASAGSDSKVKSAKTSQAANMASPALFRQFLDLLITLLRNKCLSVDTRYVMLFSLALRL